MYVPNSECRKCDVVAKGFVRKFSIILVSHRANTNMPVAAIKYYYYYYYLAKIYKWQQNTMRKM